MKKILVFSLIVSLSLMAPLTVKAQQIKDIPPDHWAYKIVAELIDRGFLSLYDDGSFLGQKEVTRFQLAEALAHILVYLESAEVGLTGHDIQNIRLLTVEFRKELVDMAEDIEGFRKRIVDLENYTVINYEDMGHVYKKMDTIEMAISEIINEIVLLYALQKQVDQLTGDLEKNEQDLSYLKTTVNSGRENLEEISTTLENAQKELARLGKDNRNMKLYIGGLAGVMVVIIILSLK